MNRFKVFLMLIAVWLLFTPMAQAQNCECLDVKCVSIYEVLTENGEGVYENSKKLVWKYHTKQGLHGVADVGDVPRHFRVLPEIVKIDHRVPTTVVWRNETNVPITLVHDVIERRKSEEKSLDSRIPAGGRFSFTFKPSEHPGQALYYTVGPENQPGQTIGYPFTN